MTDKAETIKAWSGLVATVAIPITLAVITSSYNKAVTDRDRSVRYIEIVSDILKTEKDPHIRDWAVDIINYYSDVKMSGAVKSAITGYGAATDQPDTVHGTGYLNK